VENLLDNALRHTPEGGVIEVSWRCEAGRVVFSVADTGPGIPQSDMPHLFDPLFRGETSRNRQTGGVGLGLAIARRALLASGGDLAAHNRQGGGAEFRGWLPARSVPETPRRQDAKVSVV
jgi:signal transduction histidine kinase